MCHGKMRIGLQRQVQGECKLDMGTNVNCGATVACKGDAPELTEPKCETELVHAGLPWQHQLSGELQRDASAKATCTWRSVSRRSGRRPRQAQDDD
jgi:hypothetical protein